MAVRIYTLAKELKLDSKELVEICSRAGIQDKGSALASMTDEEVARLREFMAGKATKLPERPAAGGAALVRPASPVRPAVVGKPPVIAAKNSSSTATKPAQSTPPEPKPAVVMRPLSGPLGASRTSDGPGVRRSEPAPQRPIEAVAPAQPVPQAPIAPLPPPPPPPRSPSPSPSPPPLSRSSGPLRREDYIAPGGVAARAKPPELGGKSTEPRPRPRARATGPAPGRPGTRGCGAAPRV